MRSELCDLSDGRVASMLREAYGSASYPLDAFLICVLAGVGWPDFFLDHLPLCTFRHRFLHIHISIDKVFYLPCG